MSEDKTEIKGVIKTLEVDEINGVSRDATDRLMTSANIRGASISAYTNGTISTMALGETSTAPVTSGTVFGVASLSKPVFAYLVLKLIEANKPGKVKPVFGTFNTEFNLKTPLYTVFQDEKGQTIQDDINPFLMKFDPEQIAQAKLLTAEMVLSHRTGLHITDKVSYKFQFQPGAHYAYSGPGIDCLQGVIERLTCSDPKKTTNLEQLAQKYVFGVTALNLPNSTYGSNPNAANSLRTTSAEYIQFITAWLNDKQLNYAFNAVEPFYSMQKDYFPVSDDKLVEQVMVNDSDREHVTWGLGIGLVTNDQGQIIGAYHTGDMNEDRAGFGVEIDPETKQCLAAYVYCANSHNGHILAEHVLPASLKPALNYFFPTYGFARNVEELDGTDFHGTNPKILKPELKMEAYKTKPLALPHKDRLKKMKSEESQHMKSFEEPSLDTKAQDKYNALPTIPKPPWEQ